MPHIYLKHICIVRNNSAKENPFPATYIRTIVHHNSTADSVRRSLDVMPSLNIGEVGNFALSSWGIVPLCA